MPVMANMDSWKNSMFWFGNNLSCLKIILEFREFWNQIPWCRCTYIELFNASQLCWSNFQASTLCQWLPAALYAASACRLSSGPLLPSLRSSATLLLVMLIPPQDYTLPGRAPELCLCTGTCLAEEASSKRDYLWLGIWTKPHQLHLHREELCVTLFPHRPETIFCIYSSGISSGYSYLE